MTMTSEGVKPFETSAVRCLKRLDTFRCDEREVPYENSWDLSRLYKAAAAAMEIAPDQHSEQVIKQILSGVTTVVTGLGALRNSLSDAHGRGQGAVRPAPRHAKLAVNAGFAIAGFLIDTHVEKPNRESGQGLSASCRDAAKTPRTQAAYFAEIVPISGVVQVRPEQPGEPKSSMRQSRACV